VEKRRKPCRFVEEHEKTTLVGDTDNEIWRMIGESNEYLERLFLFELFMNILLLQNLKRSNWSRH
jgi:hypothetical protein